MKSVEHNAMDVAERGGRGRGRGGGRGGGREEINLSRAKVVGCCLSQVQAHANSICSHQDVTLGPRIIEEIGLLDPGS